MPARPSTFAIRLGLIALAALAIRVLHTVLISDDVRGIGDYLFYQGTANLWADGRGYIDPFLSSPDQPYVTALHPPGWPFVLAMASKLGVTTELGHKLVGAPLGAAVVAVVGLIGRRAAGERAGLVAAVVAALYPTLIAADGSLMSETLYGLFIAVALLLALRLLDTPSVVTAVILGAVLGLAALTRGEGLLFVVLLALPVAWAGGSQRRWLRLGAVVAGTAVVVLPWTARNWVELERPVLISTNDSTVVAGANCGPAYTGVDKGYWKLACIGPRTTGLNEAEQASIWRDKGTTYAREHLGGFLTVVPVRILRTWSFWQPHRQIHFAEGRDLTVEEIGLIAYFVLLPLGAFGAWTLRRQRGVLLVLLSPFLVVTVSTALSFGLPRFRHAAEISLVVLAGIGISAAARLVAQRARRSPRLIEAPGAAQRGA